VPFAQNRGGRTRRQALFAAVVLDPDDPVLDELVDDEPFDEDSFEELLAAGSLEPDDDSDDDPLLDDSLELEADSDADELEDPERLSLR
jgi:hypothetical protein